MACGVKKSASASSTIWVAINSVKMRSPKMLGGGLPLLRANARIGRNERGVERAFGEDGAEVVGQAKGDEKSVGDRAGAQESPPA